MKTRVAVSKKGTPIDVYILTQDEIQAMDNDSQGICLGCGNVQDGCEPDARKYECDECNEPRVYGTMEALMMGRVEVGGWVGA